MYGQTEELIKLAEQLCITSAHWFDSAFHAGEITRHEFNIRPSDSCFDRGCEGLDVLNQVNDRSGVKVDSHVLSIPIVSLILQIPIDLFASRRGISARGLLHSDACYDLL
jgi:hypothetical protein